MDCEKAIFHNPTVHCGMPFADWFDFASVFPTTKSRSCSAVPASSGHFTQIRRNHRTRLIGCRGDPTESGQTLRIGDRITSLLLAKNCRLFKAKNRRTRARGRPPFRMGASVLEPQWTLDPGPYHLSHRVRTASSAGPVNTALDSVGRELWICHQTTHRSGSRSPRWPTQPD